MAQILNATISFMRKIFALERLPPPPEPARAGGHRAGGLLALFVPESLPRDPERPASPRRGWLGLLFAPERLPLDPPPPPRRRGRALAAIFAPERLDPP